MKDQLRIIFYGTPDFAVSSLSAILKAGFNVVAVVTAPDRKAGRGMKLTPSAVKKFALEQGLDVLQPSNLKSEEFQAQLASYSPDIQIVIAFRMMPEKVWNFPPLGTVNLHASLLPNYRGAAPINWAVINGETKTGVTTFRLKHEIDTGNLLMQKEVEILPEDTAGSMHDKLMVVGAGLIVETLHAISDGTAKEIPQNLEGVHRHAPKIFKDDCQIDWSAEAKDIHNLIRGLSPYPVARTTIGGKTLKIFESSLIQDSKEGEPGTISTDGKTFVRVAAQNGTIELNTVQLEGKRRMKIDEFLRGYNFTSDIGKMG